MPDRGKTIEFGAKKLKSLCCGCIALVNVFPNLGEEVEVRREDERDHHRQAACSHRAAGRDYEHCVDDGRIIR